MIYPVDSVFYFLNNWGLAIEGGILCNVCYVVRYRPESKPRQEASHLERTLHLDKVCRHRNQLIDRTKNVYCLKSNNNSSVETDLDGPTFSHIKGFLQNTHK